MDLGQVFTKKHIADYMVSLFDLDKHARVLDPCAGEGVFLQSLKEYGYDNISGYEIDSSLCSRKKALNLNIKNADFFSEQEKYDGIIMNPPYIRQEKIDDLKEPFGITKERLRENQIFRVLPKTANLYMYFIVKAIDLLRNRGELVAIFPGSWTNTNNGKKFFDIFSEKCQIDKIVFLTGNVFETQALVDVIIMKLTKGKSGDIPAYEFFEYDGERIINRINEKARIELGFERTFTEISSIRRGISTGCNAIFINPVDHNCRTVPILSSPKKVSGYSTENSVLDTLMTEPSFKYKEQCEKKILKDKKPASLVNMIEAGKDWTKVNTFDCRGILFGYFVRNDMKFVMNKANIMVRDNFYICYPKIDPYLFMALMNNYYTYYQLECSGKLYGAGLLKLQRYDLEQLTFVQSVEDEQELIKLSKQLIETGDSRTIELITKEISKSADVSCDKIKKSYENIKAARLER